MNNESFNGWTNHQTWQANLEIFDGMEWHSPEDLESIAADVLYCDACSPTLHGLVTEFLRKVNFQEISEALKENEA